MMNKKGVLGLPIQYTVAIIMAAISISLMIYASYDLWKGYEEKKAIKEANKIVDEAERIYGMGENGTMIKLKVDIPTSVNKIVFGSHNRNEENHYYILMNWGKNMSFFSSAKFSYSITYGGIREVKIKMEEQHVKIYG